MVADSFRHVTAWVFDLDNTLYPPEARLFDQIETRMTRWVMEALDLQQSAAMPSASNTGAATAPRSQD